MKIFLIIFLTSLVILLLVILLNSASYNGLPSSSKTSLNDKKSE